MNRELTLQAGQKWVHADIVKESGDYIIAYHLDAHANLDYHLQIDPTFNGSITLAFHARGEYAHAKVRGLYILDDRQQVTITTQQIHHAPHTRTDLLIKGLVGGKAQSIYKGTIYVHPGAAHAHAAQYNKNMLLSSTARAQSIPSLEVLHNNVRCMHGSAVGKLSQDHLYYLQSRGLTRLAAQTILLEAFCADVITMDDELRTKINAIAGGSK